MRSTGTMTTTTEQNVNLNLCTTHTHRAPGPIRRNDCRHLISSAESHNLYTELLFIGRVPITAFPVHDTYTRYMHEKSFLFITCLFTGAIYV